MVAQFKKGDYNNLLDDYIEKAKNPLMASRFIEAALKKGPEEFEKFCSTNKINVTALAPSLLAKGKITSEFAKTLLELAEEGATKMGATITSKDAPLAPDDRNDFQTRLATLSEGIKTKIQTTNPDTSLFDILYPVRLKSKSLAMILLKSNLSVIEKDELLGALSKVSGIIATHLRQADEIWKEQTQILEADREKQAERDRRAKEKTDALRAAELMKAATVPVSTAAPSTATVPPAETNRIKQMADALLNYKGTYVKTGPVSEFEKFTFHKTKNLLIIYLSRCHLEPLPKSLDEATRKNVNLVQQVYGQFRSKLLLHEPSSVREKDVLTWFKDDVVKYEKEANIRRLRLAELNITGDQLGRLNKVVDADKLRFLKAYEKLDLVPERHAKQVVDELIRNLKVIPIKTRRAEPSRMSDDGKLGRKEALLEQRKRDLSSLDEYLRAIETAYQQFHDDPTVEGAFGAFVDNIDRAGEGVNPSIRIDTRDPVFDYIKQVETRYPENLSDNAAQNEILVDSMSQFVHALNDETDIDGKYTPPRPFADEMRSVVRKCLDYLNSKKETSDAWKRYYTTAVRAALDEATIRDWYDNFINAVTNSIYKLKSGTFEISLETSRDLADRLLKSAYPSTRVVEVFQQLGYRIDAAKENLNEKMSAYGEDIAALNAEVEELRKSNEGPRLFTGHACKDALGAFNTRPPPSVWVALNDQTSDAALGRTPFMILCLYFDTLENVLNKTKETTQHDDGSYKGHRAYQPLRALDISANKWPSGNKFAIGLPAYDPLLTHDAAMFDHVLKQKVNVVRDFIANFNPGVVLWPGNSATDPSRAAIDAVITRGVTDAAIKKLAATKIRAEMTQLVEEIHRRFLEPITVGPDVSPAEFSAYLSKRVRAWTLEKAILNLEQLYAECSAIDPDARDELARLRNQKHQELIARKAARDAAKERLQYKRPAPTPRPRRTRRREPEPDLQEFDLESESGSEVLPTGEPYPAKTRKASRDGVPYRAFDPRFEQGGKQIFLEWMVSHKPTLKAKLMEIIQYILTVEENRRLDDGSIPMDTNPNPHTDPLPWFKKEEEDLSVAARETIEEDMDRRFKYFMYPKRDSETRMEPSIVQYRSELKQIKDEISKRETEFQELYEPSGSQIAYVDGDFWDLFSMLFLKEFKRYRSSLEPEHRTIFDVKLRNAVNLLARVKDKLYRDEKGPPVHCEGTRKNDQQVLKRTDGHVHYREYDYRFLKGIKYKTLVERFSKNYRYLNRRIVPSNAPARFARGVRYAILDNLVQACENYAIDMSVAVNPADKAKVVDALKKQVMKQQNLFWNDDMYVVGDFFNERIARTMKRTLQKRVKQGLEKHELHAYQWKASIDDFIDLFSLAFTFAMTEKRRNDNLNPQPPSTLFYTLKNAIWPNSEHASCLRKGKNDQRYRRTSTRFKRDERPFEPDCHAKDFNLTRKRNFCMMTKRARRDYYTKHDELLKPEANSACPELAARKREKLETFKNDCGFDEVESSPIPERSEDEFPGPPPRPFPRPARVVTSPSSDSTDEEIDPKTCPARKVKVISEREYLAMSVPERTRYFRTTALQLHPDRNRACERKATRKSQRLNALHEKRLAPVTRRR